MKYGIWLIVFIAAITCFAGPVGYIDLNGLEKRVYSEIVGGRVIKFFYNNDGKRVDLNEYLSELKSARWMQQGVFTTRAFNRLNQCGEFDSIPVEITFRLDWAPGSLAGSKLTPQEHSAMLSRSFYRGTATAMKVLPDAPFAKTLFSGSTSTKTTLTKADLLKLKHVPEIVHIETIKDIPEEAIITEQHMSTSYGGLPHGLFMTSLGSYLGTGVKIGVVGERNISSADLTSYFNNTPITFRTPNLATDPHAKWVGGMIRNAVGYGFGMGGSPSLGEMLYAGWSGNVLLSEIDACYQWVADNGGRITSNSWGVSRWRGSNYEQVSNWIAQRTDTRAAVSPYMTNVFSAGNAGTAAEADNIECANFLPDDSWTSETCQQVFWHSKNSIVVGAIDHNNFNRGWSFSSWRNGTDQDEKPHVVSVGELISTPVETGGTIRGTSFSGPEIACVVANLYCYKPSLITLPELAKVSLMAAGSLRRVSGETGYYASSTGTDLKGGAGVPRVSFVKALADNWQTNPQSFTVNGGASEPKATALWNVTFASGNPTLNTAIHLNNVAAGYLNIFTTWISSPDEFPDYDDYSCDDLDLDVTSGGTTYQSHSIYNSSEAVKFYWPGGSGDITAQVGVTTRRTSSNVPIYVGCALIHSLD